MRSQVQTQVQAPPAEAQKAVVRRLFEVINTGDLSGVDDLLTEDYVLHYPGFPPSGRDAFKRIVPMFRTACPDLQATLEEFVVEGDRVAARFAWTGTHLGELLGVPPTGRRVHVTGIGLYRVRDGRIAEDRVEEDLLGLLRQVGVVPGGGAPPSERR